MTTNLRVSLTILSLGFGIEGAGELYSFLSKGAFRPGVSLLFFLPVAMTLVGLLFVWVGQHEWNELHRDRVRTAHRIFAVSLLGAVVAGAVVAALLFLPGLGIPLWARVVFAAAAGSLVLGTFVTYALLVFHLVATPSKAALLAAIAWALVVATFVGATLGANLSDILATISERTLVDPAFLGPVGALSSYLFVSYFLLLAVYVDAHRTVLRGPSTAPAPSPPPVPGPDP